MHDTPHGQPIPAAPVAAYLDRAFKTNLPAAKVGDCCVVELPVASHGMLLSRLCCLLSVMLPPQAAMEELAGTIPADKIGDEAWGLYTRFRP